MRPQPRAPRAVSATGVLVVPVVLVVLVVTATSAGLAGCGARQAAPELRTGAEPEVCALDGRADDTAATREVIVQHRGTWDADALDAELAWVADETGTRLTRSSTMATGALVLRADRQLGGQGRVDVLCALERLAAVRHVEPNGTSYPG